MHARELIVRQSLRHRIVMGGILIAWLDARAERVAAGDVPPWGWRLHG